MKYLIIAMLLVAGSANAWTQETYDNHEGNGEIVGWLTQCMRTDLADKFKNAANSMATIQGLPKNLREAGFIAGFNKGLIETNKITPEICDPLIADLEPMVLDNCSRYCWEPEAEALLDPVFN